jgi:hypothetical protein
VGDADSFIDLLFYHVRLRCYVAVELKATAFKPEHVGKMNFYLSAVDDLLKHKDDQPSIGLLLCRSRNRVQVEYALRDVRKPIGVAQWETRIVEALPENLKGSLPSWGRSGGSDERRSSRCEARRRYRRQPEGGWVWRLSGRRLRSIA